jgi:radical SAM protein with 4Fe4S-binding SPASM domain
MVYNFSRFKEYFYSGCSYILGLEKVFGPPAKVHIEITNICNFRCIYCPQSIPDEHFKILGRGKMSYEAYKAIVDKLVETYRFRKIVLTRDGEPLVHPELEKFVKYNTLKGLKTTMGSNGSLITQNRALNLINNGLSLMKGDFCYDKEKYESLRVGSNYEKSLQGYTNILRAAKEQDANFMLVLVDLNTYSLTDRNVIIESIAQLRSLFNGYEKWLDAGKAVMHNALGESKTTFSSSGKLFKGKKINYNLCHHPWLEMIIDYKGNVVGCCRDLRSEYQLGNILHTDDIAKNIWNGTKIRYLRKSLLKKRPENINICNKCDLPYGISYAGSSIPKKILRFLRQ